MISETATGRDCSLASGPTVLISLLLQYQLCSPQPFPFVTEVSSPALAVMVRLKHPLVESREKNCWLLCWPVLPVMLKLASNSNVSLGVTVLETTLKTSLPSSPLPVWRLRNCCLIVVVCAPLPSGLMVKEKPRFSGHSKRCNKVRFESPRPFEWMLVSEEISVCCVIFCTNAVFVILKLWLLEKPMSCFTVVSTRPCDVRTNPATTKWRAEVTLTVPVMLPLGSVVRFSATSGLGPEPIVFRVISPVTTFDPLS